MSDQSPEVKSDFVKIKHSLEFEHTYINREIFARYYAKCLNTLINNFSSSLQLNYETSFISFIFK
jgi:hypothetical protein